MRDLTVIGADEPLFDACGVLERDGAVIIDGFADAAALDGLHHDLEQPLSAAAWGQNSLAGARTRRIGGVFRHTPHAVSLVRQPHFAAAADHFLRGPSRRRRQHEPTHPVPSIQVGLTQATAVHPDEGAQALHRADTAWDWGHPGDTDDPPQARVQMILALSDFTEQNGATRVATASHRWPDGREPSDGETVPAVMRKGSALLILGGTYRGGGRNLGDAPRIGVTIALDLGYLRQQENQYLAVPLETVQALPPDVQGLLGWQLCRGDVGHVVIDGQITDPHFLLD